MRNCKKIKYMLRNYYSFGLSGMGNTHKYIRFLPSRYSLPNRVENTGRKSLDRMETSHSSVLKCHVRGQPSRVVISQAESSLQVWRLREVSSRLWDAVWPWRRSGSWIGEEAEQPGQRGCGGPETGAFCVPCSVWGSVRWAQNVHVVLQREKA